MNQMFSINKLFLSHRPKVFKLLMIGVTALGVSFLTPQSAKAQQNNSTSSPSTGNIPTYPKGTRIYPNGVINPPRGRAVYPATTINNGNGTTTYYYQDGTRITTDSNTVSPGGTFLTPGSLNGGVRRTQESSNRELLLTPGSANRRLNNP
jgi:hypothetical protein